MLRRRTALLTTTGVTIAAALTACGNPITANHDWRSLDALVTVSEHVGPDTLVGTVLAGRLADANGQLVPNTVFTETCAQVKKTGTSATTYKCLALINTGQKVYVAGGMASGPFGTLTSLSGGSTPGSLRITKLSGTQPASKPLLIKISAIKG